MTTLFCQFLSGYVGPSADRRGRGIDDQPLWSVLEVHELLDERLVACWQNRPHAGLREPLHPGRAFTPNKAYALGRGGGWLRPGRPRPGGLPGAAASTGAGGQRRRGQLHRRSYDSEEFDPLRLVSSGVREKNNL